MVPTHVPCLGPTPQWKSLSLAIDGFAKINFSLMAFLLLFLKASCPLLLPQAHLEKLGSTWPISMPIGPKLGSCNSRILLPPWTVVLKVWLPSTSEIHCQWTCLSWFPSHQWQSHTTYSKWLGTWISRHWWIHLHTQKSSDIWRIAWSPCKSWDVPSTTWSTVAN